MSAAEKLRRAGMVHFAALYNNDVELWRNARIHYASNCKLICVIDGHIVAGSDGIVARCADDKAAIAMLEAAGYIREPVSPHGDHAIIFNAGKL